MMRTRKPKRLLDFTFPHAVIRVLLPSVFLTGFLVSANFMLLSNKANALDTVSIESVKASTAHAYQEGRGRVSSRSLTPDISGFSDRHNPQAEDKQQPCLKFLSASKDGFSLAPSPSALRADGTGYKSATPVALGLFIGARLALGPTEKSPISKRIQISPEIRTRQDSGASPALAIAAYRSCMKHYQLAQTR